MKSQFRTKLDEHLAGLPWAEGFDHHTHHLPDELCLDVQSFEDYTELLSFLADNTERALHFEIGPDVEATQYIKRLAKYLSDPEISDYLGGLGEVSSPWSLLAYATIIALGN
ncbi:hypothetical protein [Altererythrobacter lutimaris]|uniref:Uncharacterized protein n=1 Tax=Altererythrobacter lutimaris TaxID=2743979 RepID=A0A850HE13_9SPHN|nr:hypothetical protein [Altererythrobacter lutimaris]NVE95038.1 hypothetical protein [Altererythrobacter lutimaris]